jgi:hypothetical protein
MPGATPGRRDSIVIRLKGTAMKLASTLVEKTASQLDAQAVPENHPAMPELSKRFGEHTFFLDGNGLNIVEPAEADEAVWKVVKIASWSNEERTSLMPHSPEPTGVVVPAEGKGPDGAA